MIVPPSPLKARIGLQNCARYIVIWLAIVALWAAPKRAFGQISHTMVGGNLTYVVQPEDTLTMVGARFGVSPSALATLNAVRLSSKLKPGQALRIDNRHIVPAGFDQGILINVPQRMLFLFRNHELVSSYPVAVGRPGWRTPVKPFTVVRLDRDPVWIVPPSIQREMAANGQEVRTVVEPGPDNPLGRYRIKLSIPSVSIHSTIAPASIYSFRTHGCIRLRPENAEALFNRALVGMPGAIIYEPVLLAVTPDRRVFAEVEPDPYHKNGNPLLTLQTLADSQKLANMIDWSVVSVVANRREGIARDVTKGGMSK